jgi:serine/threonine protein kinase
MLLVAVGEGRTLSGDEALQFERHVATCETCRTLALETSDDRLRWVARIPEDALDDPDLLVLPTVDPIVFAKGEEIAHGGMGRITRARDRRLGRDVAIKEVLAPHLRARFEREAMITSSEPPGA